MNRICIVVALLLVNISAYSQDKLPVEFGIEHSINLSSLKGNGGPVVYVNREEYYEFSGNRPTFDLGMFAIVHFSDLLAIQPELAYSGAGGYFERESVIFHDLGATRGREDLAFALDYLKLNVLANIKLGTGFYFQAGGYASSLLAAEISYPWFLSNTSGEDTSIFGDVESVDYGLVGGMGLSTKIVNISFRYNYGLVDLFQSGEFEALELNNSALQLVFHWKLRSDLR